MDRDDLSIGSTLLLEFSKDNLEKSTPIHATITHAFTPFTMSPVLKVELREGDARERIPSEAILKLYDRRCLNNIREECGDTEGYSKEAEQAYRQYAGSLEASQFDFDDWALLYRTEMSDGQFEAYIAHCCDEMFNAELYAYNRLVDLQGTGIPRLYGTVKYIFPLEHEGQHIEIRGLLLEYIPSVSLRTFVRDPMHVSRIPDICQRCVSLINQVSDRGILNKDVRLDNFLISESAITSVNISDARCVLIDLAQCRFRGDEENDEEWRAAKQSQDEEGDVGYVVQREIKCHVGEGVWAYKPSGRYYIQY